MGGPELAVSHRLAVPVRRGLREDAAAEDAGDADEDEGAEVYGLERGVRFLLGYTVAVLRDSLISLRAVLPERLARPTLVNTGKKV